MDLVNAPNATAVTAIQSGLATAAALDAVDNFVDTEVGAIKAVTDKLDTALELDGAVYRYTTNALEQASGTGATAQQVWEYDTRSLTDKAGFGLADDAITAAKYDQSTAYPLASSDGSDLTACATAAGFSTHSAADVKTAIEAAGSHLTLVKAVTDKVDTALELDGAVYRYTTNALEQAPSGGLDAAGVRTALGMAAANLDDQLDALPTAAENADATWDEALSEHTNVGSAGAGLSAAGSAGDPWSTAIPGSYAAGTAGQIVGDNVDGLAALIGSGGITVVSPVSEDGGTITIVQGDDYNNSDGRALEWFSDDWPDITGASITLHIEDSGGTYSEAGSVVTGGSGTQTVRVELPSADTATLDAGFQKFHLEAVLTSGRVVTLATGVAHVIADI
jgi:nitrate reductase assembly molybdenum cofactor insertion protein NarJ